MSLVRVEERGPLRLVRLDKGRGNAIDPPLVEELIAIVAQLRSDESARGVLLASAHPRLFCPGLDLVTLFSLDRPAMEHFMLRFAELLWDLYSLPRPLLAGVSGAAVAGGCVLALTADWRVLARGASIGLNEVKIGVPLPWSVALLLQSTVGPGSFAAAGLLGRNFSDAGALQAGLADEVAEVEGFEGTCLARLEEFASKDSYSFARIKAYSREATLASMKGGERQRLPEWLDGWFSEATRERIAATLAAITRK
jgi:Delta3-Delta2-enoyl-CoA isomerase